MLTWRCLCVVPLMPCSWLRPYPNGALPLLQIRNTLTDLLAVMNLDTSNDYTREKLEHSELGKIIMFYEKNPHDKTSTYWLAQPCSCLLMERTGASNCSWCCACWRAKASVVGGSGRCGVWLLMYSLCWCLWVSAVGLKTKCRDLILAWSAPIFADADAEMRKRRAREREHRCGRQLALMHYAYHCHQVLLDV
jgi:hypothetical protein